MESRPIAMLSTVSYVDFKVQYLYHGVALQSSVARSAIMPKAYQVCLYCGDLYIHRVQWQASLQLPLVGLYAGMAVTLQALDGVYFRNWDSLSAGVYSPSDGLLNTATAVFSTLFSLSLSYWQVLYLRKIISFPLLNVATSTQVMVVLQYMISDHIDYLQSAPLRMVRSSSG